MAKVNFNNLDEAELNGGNNNGNGSDVGFFTLKNDNDEAVVRFMCDSTDDFEILTVHDVQIGQRYRKVNCIRDPREPLDNCPLCKNGTRISNRFFIKLIQYNRVTDPNTGVQTIVPQAMIWERSTAYAKTLKSYLDNYGPLSDVICKIIRHGKAGDMQTTYEIVPNLSKTVFPDEVYVKDPTLFGTFEAFGTIVMDRNYDEMAHFVATGEFPARQPAQQNEAPAAPAGVPTGVAPRTYDAAPVPTQTYQAPAAVPVTPNYQQPSVAPAATNVPPTGGYNTAPAAAPTYAAPTAAPVAPNFGAQAAPAQNWNNPAGGFDRPRRY